MGTLISASRAVAELGSAHVRVLDCSAGPGASDLFVQCHIAGAPWVDLETDLTAPFEDAAIGGRHPLPSVEEFAKTLGNLGVRRDHTVLLYDRSGGVMAAARMWWMLRSIGHADVSVVDGGFDALVAAEAPVSAGHSDAVETEVYVADVSEWNWPQIRMEEVATAVADGATLIDVRSAERYAGLQEPIDLIAGHIPGAINIPLSENLEAGSFKSVAALRQLYAPVIKDQTILQCGSGVTACHTLLAMVHAGFDVPTLYNGSWSQWSRNDNPMVLAPSK